MGQDSPYPSHIVSWIPCSNNNHLIYVKFSFTELLVCFFLLFSDLWPSKYIYSIFIIFVIWLFRKYKYFVQVWYLILYHAFLTLWGLGISIFFFHAHQIRWLQILCWLSFRTFILWCAMKTLGIDLIKSKSSSTTEIFTSFSWFCIWIQ